MAWIAASGWDTIDTCDPATSVIVEPARSAILRCVAGGMTRSSVPTTAQLCMLFFGRRLRPRGVRAERDRTLARDNQPPVGLGKVLCEGIVDSRWLEERLGVSFGSSGIAGDVQHRRRVRNV